MLFPIFEGNVNNKIKNQSSKKASGDNERILVVDDEIELVEASIRLLKWMGYRVTGTSDPIEALEMVRNQSRRFDLVISDLTMPMMTGIQLAEEIKRINPDIPIILLSGYGSEVASGEIKSPDISDFIIKPINKREFERVIRKVLDKSSSTEEAEETGNK